MTSVERPASGTLERWVPGLRMLRTYQFAWLPKDLAAGITLGTVMVPVGLAFGTLAGVPLAGLFAGMLPLIAYALFGSSRQLIIGPDASMAALVAISVAPLAAGDPARLALLACVLALLIGVICIAGSLLRLGFMADFLAKPVITGFMHGLALVIAVGQLPKILGVTGGGETAVEQLTTVLRNVGGTHAITLAIGVGCFAVILACRRWLPRVPGQIVALVLSLLAVRLFSLEQAGVAVIGNIPSGLPQFRIPVFGFQDFQALLPIAFAAALVAFSDTVVTARGFASRNRYRVDASQELLALGFGNIVSGLTQGLPVSGSASRTAVAEATGSRTQVTSIVAALVVAFVMLFLTDFLYSLPQAALGGILLAAAWSLCDFGEFRRLWHFRRAGLVNALITLVGVAGVGVMEGIGMGVVLSLVMLMQSLAAPGDAVLGMVGPEIYKDTQRHPEATLIKGAIVYRFSSPLFFANCGRFRDRIEELLEAAPEPLQAFILDASAIADLDLAACETIGEIHEQLKARGIRLLIAGLLGPVRERLCRGWKLAATEQELFFSSVGAAVENTNCR